MMIAEWVKRVVWPMVLFDGLAAWELRRRRSARKAKGICTECGRRRAQPGKRNCLECQTEANACSQRTYRRRVAEGICPKCGGEPESPWVQCSTCRERDAYHREQRRDRGYVRPSRSKADGVKAN